MPKRTDRFHGRYEGSGRRCDWPGCNKPGEFRAPPEDVRAGASRYDGPGEWRWFCLDHIRAFNQGYNYFAGMSMDEIYEAQRPASGWDTETRAFASASVDAPRWADFHDPLDAIGAKFKENLKQRSQAAKDAAGLDGVHPFNRSEQKALETLGLTTDADRQTIRRRYSALVRKYHPDRNGGNRAYEKQLQAVVEAYQRLRKSAVFV
ncbi:MAG: J domain-containing protein [Pseudomonadota bacterium]